MKKFKDNLILFIAPTLFGLLILYIYQVRGPHYIQIPQDLAYQNIFNALNIIEGKSPGMLLYPAITLNYLFILIIKISSLFNNESVVDFSLNNIEFLCKIFSYISIILLLSAIFFQSYIYKKKIFPLYLIIFFQGLFFFVQPINLFLNLFISAEAILLILGIILLSTIKIFEENYNLKFTIVSSIICSVAILTKLTALPFILLPILLIKNFKFKIYFFICLLLFSIIFTFVVILIFNNSNYIYEIIRGIFFGFKNIISSSSTEREIISSNLGTAIIQQQFIIFKNYFLTFVIFVINLFLVFFIKYKKNRIPNKFYFYILFIVIYYFYLSLRPKPHYFFIIHLFVIFSLIEVTYFLIKTKIKFKYNYLFSSIFIAVIFLKSFLIIDNNLFKKIKNSVLDANQIRHFYNLDDTNKALITAVQASDMGSGYFHANEKREHLEYISKILPLNEFNFIFTEKNENIFSQNFNIFSVNDLVKNYDDVYFWSGNDKFQNIENDKIPINSKIPNHLYKIIYKGQWESIAKIIGIKVFEKKVNHKICEDVFCYKLYLPNNLEYNGIGIKYEDSNLKKKLKITYNQDENLKNKFIEETSKSKYFSQYFIDETNINNIKIISNSKISKIFMYQDINKIDTKFEYMPISIFKGKSKDTLRYVKQYNYSIKNNEFIEVNFEEKIKPKKIVLNNISSNFNVKVDLFGFENKIEKYIKSAEKINNKIIITLDNNEKKYSSYLLSFKIKKINHIQKEDLMLKLKNKLKKLLLNHNLSSANIETIDFIF